MNQKIDNAIGGYEDCHPVNAPREYTREELVVVIEKAISFADFDYGLFHYEATCALDALIAIGTLEVRG